MKRYKQAGSFIRDVDFTLNISKHIMIDFVLFNKTVSNGIY